MICWIDAQLPPALAPWVGERFNLEAYSVTRLGYRDASDYEIFSAARKVDAVVITKDRDFVNLLEQNGPPPRVLLVTLGNTSNAHMKAVLERVFPRAIELLEAGEALIEIGEHAGKST